VNNGVKERERYVSTFTSHMNLGLTGGVPTGGEEDAAVPVMEVQQKHKSTSRRGRGLALVTCESRASKQLWELDGMMLDSLLRLAAEGVAAEPASSPPMC
jgi:hypothetical protein